MRFNLIGPFEIITDDGEICIPGTPKVCQTLALLLSRPNETVTADTLIRELWGDNPSGKALATVQTYIHHVRHRLLAHGTAAGPRHAAAPGRPTLITRPPGYLLQIDEEAIDTTAFERLVVSGDADLKAGRTEFASRRLREALALWRGPVLSNVPTGPVLAGRVVYLDELRVRALELRIETEIRLGHRREILPELRSLVHDYPFNEWFHGQLIAILHHCGRRAEALSAYRELRRILRSELGLDPSADLQRLQREVLGPRPAGVLRVAPQQGAAVTPLSMAALD
ncbi:AfsR/SARP family transcriptional regulator [Streptomyces sp. A3M-1-3]|uniref:AfsR/SARP family transcriptional regulator n=1 Tax=Streptomyces sp. A3M-1-3 TaxID=2962044 RepID=UPI0020B739EE|nr:AfsR/SARP family transcriptional regulator [Streptomyces sp. A3M-1-3]MCP3822827.1 AfsR/SARP family transcriptional regulator [Streptomyces sp. A3M-1-3]